MIKLTEEQKLKIQEKMNANYGQKLEFTDSEAMYKPKYEHKQKPTGYICEPVTKTVSSNSSKQTSNKQESLYVKCSDGRLFNTETRTFVPRAVLAALGRVSEGNEIQRPCEPNKQVSMTKIEPHLLKEYKLIEEEYGIKGNNPEVHKVINNYALYRTAYEEYLLSNAQIIGEEHTSEICKLNETLTNTKVFLETIQTESDIIKNSLVSQNDREVLSIMTHNMLQIKQEIVERNEELTMRLKKVNQRLDQVYNFFK